jgi:hypothetical protein
MLSSLAPVAPVAIVATDIDAITVVHTYKKLGQHTKFHAEDFQLWLALDKGYRSELKPLRNGWRVIADDGRAVDFLK